jgi:predicted metal-dependent hydrolase
VATKQITIQEIGEVTLYKRRSTRTIRLSISARGQVKVTMPYWVPYEAGVQFAKSRKKWILEHLETRAATLQHGQAIGKSHRLIFEASPVSSKVSSRVSENVVRVTHPAACAVTDVSVQTAAEKASIRALRSQAEDELPGRLHELAQLHGFGYQSVQVKQLTGRWGSCDSRQNIVLNLFLMELPWTLIDYVLLHELTHTNILRHGPDFWEAMRQVLPDVQVRRKAIRQYRPAVGT